MAQHVAVDEKAESGGLAGPSNHTLICESRSETNTHGLCIMSAAIMSRCGLRSARLSLAPIGCTLAAPDLALRTSILPEASSMSSQRILRFGCSSIRRVGRVADRKPALWSAPLGPDRSRLVI
jgi:hypothetical protein